MADEADVLTNLESTPGNGADNQPAAGLLTQYVKDLSVENPKAPESFQWTEQPELDVQLNIGARAISDELHEVELKVGVNAKTARGTVYIVELSYCALLGLRNVPDEHAHMFMYSEAPRILFPFARRIIADATRDAGFTPLLLDPIDFQALYQQQLQQRAAEQGVGSEATPAGDA
jgi:preprotein translocase subunit SecB